MKLAVIVLLSGLSLLKGVCSTFGSGSLRTFNNSFRYLGSTCAFVFSQSYETDAQFQIVIQRGEDGILAKIKITIDSIETVVENGTVSVDGAKISLPFDHKSINIHKYGIYTRLRSRREFLSVLWNNQGNGIDALWVCQMTISNYLTSCSGPLTSEYIKICQMEFCNGLQDKKHVCPVFEEMARNCDIVTEKTYNWRKDCCKILDDRLGQNKCVEKEDCTCKFDGQIYNPKSTRTELCSSCTCESGEWNCQKKDCLSRCTIEGGSFIHTFDGTEYTLHGNCKYYIAMTITYSFTEQNIYIDEKDTNERYNSENVQFFPQSSLYIQVQTKFGMKMQIQRSPFMQLYVTLPAIAKGVTKGLCGNYNDKSDDEFMASSGIVEDSKSFAKSWRRQIQECAEISPICMNTDNEKYGKEKCAYLKDPVFAKCHSHVDYTPYLEKCVSSAKCCANPAECTCVALGNYAKACAAKGLIMENWRKDDCVEICSNNQKFSYNMKACNSTCQSLSGSDFACEVEDVPVDGCGCLEKHLNSKGMCVAETQCPCYYGQTQVSLGQNEIDGHSWPVITVKVAAIVKMDIMKIIMANAFVRKNAHACLGSKATLQGKRSQVDAINGRNKGLCGLCGNFDGDSKNDMITRGKSEVTKVLEFGNSWKVNPSCANTVNQTSPCEKHWYCNAWAERRCKIITDEIFQECHKKVDPQPYYDVCVKESCVCELEGQYLGFCTAVAAYAEACNEVDVCITWRTPDLCPVYCDYYNDPGKCSWHYKPCGTIAPKTCGNKVTSETFSAKLEGCYAKCPDNKPYLDENTMRCSALEDCTCLYNQIMQPGETIQNDCHQTCKCINGVPICTELSTTTPITTTTTKTPTTTPTTIETPTTTLTTTTTTETPTTPPTTTTTIETPTTTPTTTTTIETPTTTTIKTPTTTPTTIETPTTTPTTTTTIETSTTTTIETPTTTTTETPTTTTIKTPTTTSTTTTTIETPTTTTTETPTTTLTTTTTETPTTTPTTTPPTTTTTIETPTTTTTETPTTTTIETPTTTPTTTTTIETPTTTPTTTTTIETPTTTPTTTTTIETPTTTPTTTTTIETPTTTPTTTTTIETPTTTPTTTTTTPTTTTTTETPTTTPTTTTIETPTTTTIETPTTLPTTTTTIETPTTTPTTTTIETPTTTTIETPTTLPTTTTTIETPTTTPTTTTIETPTTTPTATETPTTTTIETTTTTTIETPTTTTTETPTTTSTTTTTAESPTATPTTTTESPTTTTTTTGQCEVYGDPHYKTFSGTAYTFLENCTYTLVEEKAPIHNFSVAVDNYNCIPGYKASCARGLILKYKSNIVTLSIVNYKIVSKFNNKQVNFPYENDGIQLESTRTSVKVFIPAIHTRVSLASYNEISIRVPRSIFENNTQGQCVLAAVVYAQDECIRNSCHPQLGDLLIGRSSQLSATSTCGLNGPQKYCILGYLENEQKCFTCDSSYPYNRYNNPYSHQIENIITTFEPDRKLKWWQSENGVDRVSIRLDLEALFQFSHLVLTFKTFRPAEMLIERSRDNGRTWKVFRYFSQDCESSFPGIPTGPAQRIEDVICDSKYSGTEPSTDGEVVLKALDPNFQIENPYNPHIQELITMTNLRVNFTRLLTLGDTLLLRRKRNPQEKYYYALYEMVVRGSCFCNGHASQCMPVDNARGDVFREQRMCEAYFRQRGYAFKFRNGKFVLTKIAKRSIREKQQAQQNTIPLDPGSPLQIIFRQRSPDRPVTWTGPGFVRVQDGAGLRFTVNNIPAFLDYSIVIRYEPEASDDWTAEIKVTPISIASDGRCPNQELETETATLSASSRTDLGEYQHYQCIEIASEVGSQLLPEVCERLIASMSARIHNGAVSCKCNAQGSVSAACIKFGGQCQCKPNVIGRCCDTCAPSSFGFGSSGCTSCDCDPQGSVSEMCDQANGQCPCRREIYGRQCSQCQPGYFGFPQCRPCQCNGNSEICDPRTGACLNCRGFSTGNNCERCLEGYHGDPTFREPCEPCLCPDTKASGRYFAHSCNKDHNALQEVCNCIEGYAGAHCDKCPAGYYGSLTRAEDRCQQCRCNNNIDPTEPDACDGLTGECLKCLYNTDGPNCQFCRPGYFGSALQQNCIACNCTIEGTERPVCDQFTGTCNCRTGVIGKFCDQCARGFLPEFPACTSCHPCFELWDKNVSDIRQTLQKLIKAASVMHDDKLPTYEKQFEELEKKLAEVQRLLNSPVASLEEVQKAEELCDQIRRTTDQIDPNSIVVDDTPVLNSKINSIRNELNLHFNDLKNRVKLIFKFDVTKLLDVYNTIKKHYKDSNNTEQRVKNTQPTIDQSRNTREKAMGLLDKASLPEDLDALQKKINELNVKDLNEKVCGAPGDEQCSEATCGGALCRDIFGNRKCGGPYCKGTLPVAHSATEEAKKTEKKIPTLLTQLEDSEKELGNAKITAQETKEKASELSKKITKNKDKYEKEKEETNALIKSVKDFLTGDSVLPEDIEKIAEAVLALKIPSSPSPEDLIRKIQNILVDCKKIESVIDNLNNKNHEVKELLEQAKEAEKRAKATDITEAKKALEKAKEVQDKVKKSIEETKDNFEAINDNIYQTKEKLDRIEDNNMDLMNRLNDLNRQIKNLKEKTEMNGLQAKDAKEAAEGALANATEAEKDLKVVNDLFQKLKEKEKGNGASQEAIDKAKMLKTEAEELAKDVGGKMKDIMVAWVHVLAQGPQLSYGCAEGSCYPATGDLLIGRADRLSSSSTCGLLKPEPFCIVSHLQEEKKCFVCDSKERYDENVNHTTSHGIENVVTTFAHNRLKTWWQSENGISVGPMKKVNDVICDSRYSDIEPSTEGEVIFRVLDPAFRIDDPYSPSIQNMLKITNLRINLTRLHTLGDNLLDSRMEIKEKYYYAIYDMVVRGNCFCYGHASECAPIDGTGEDVEGMVHGHCMCRHHTKGLNCEQCEDFYHDLPWRPAEGRNSNACKKCNCNEHSFTCHFDMAVYMSTGNVSGGVCDSCEHNTMGHNCEQCKPFFYQHPERDIRDPNICEQCNCDPVGSHNGGICDRYTDFSTGLIAGQCRCKPNVEGERCDQCKEGFYGLSDDPLGCQPCTCSPLGMLPGGNPCNVETGNCYCKRLVTGRNCDQCLPQHWGLSNDLDGCRSCDCDHGGALNNNCSAATGQCECREHMFGRQCSEVESGFYFIALDHYTYEAEDANFGPGVSIVQRPYPQDRTPTWTGIGFVNVPEGAYLEFYIDNIPTSMEYDILIRYEPQLPDKWEEAVITVVRPDIISTSSRCVNTVPDDDNQVVSLPPGSRYVVLPRPVCFEQGLNYTVRLHLPLYSPLNDVQSPYTLIDSIVLMPHCKALEMFTSGSGEDVATNSAWETFQRYRCLENSQSVVETPMTDICRNIIFSISALLHQGALSCQCDPQGSLSTVCNPSGGQCQCRPNVIGRNCDKCAPATYLFGPSGCRYCECNPQGSSNSFCHVETGQCQCIPGAYGRQCERCLPGYWGFPNCRPCNCNGHTDHCDPQTGECVGCKDQTTGRTCDRCLTGYYGNPILGSGDHCRPCLCPDGPNSGRQFASSCYQSQDSLQVSCACSEGYAGARCDDCAPGYYGNPEEVGGVCKPCQCNNNIDMLDSGSCGARTGICLKCLYHTEGGSCERCKLGYYGDALTQTCRKCVCNYLGTVNDTCPSSNDCHCDLNNGQCQCLPNAIGQNCDQCATDTWNLASGNGCEDCDCDETRSFGSSCNEVPSDTVFFMFFSACDCEPSGVQTPQCDRTDGNCICEEGIAGPRCDKCARGYSGVFPDCVQCHRCFAEWDVIIGDLTNKTHKLVKKVNSIKASGITGPYQDTVNAIEQRANDIRSLLAQNPAAQPLNDIQNLLEEAEKLITEVNKNVQNVELKLAATSANNSNTNTELDDLQKESQNLNKVVNDLAEQLEFVKNSDIQGALDSVNKYFQQSMDAESRVNTSTTDPDNTVEQSSAIRQQVEDLMNETRIQFEENQENYTKHLDDLAAQLQTLDLFEVNEKTCGSSGVSCTEGQCGGLSCRDEDGTMKCGGEGCDGLVTLSHNAWKKAVDFDREILNALAEVDQLSKMVSEAKLKADEAKLNAQEVLQKTNSTKQKVDKSNEDLRNLIKQIREFLTQDGADLESIEAVANEVLKMQMPTTPQQLQELTDDIRERVESLSDVEIILNQSADDIHRAETLLGEARKASKEATDVKNTADMVKEALEEAEKAQNAAEKAIKQADVDIRGTQDLLTSIESETAASESRLNNATQRLAQLEKDIGDLKQKASDNKDMAEEIEKSADKVKHDAEEAKRELDDELKNRYGVVEDLIVQKSEGVADARQRAEALQNEAKQLLSHAGGRLQELKDLEKTYEDNQKTLEDKAKLLVELEEAVRSLLKIISQKVAVYSTCL
ncbi:UNVERIFIED_CONTAM: hypothetical protein FKN15_034351 [Acipenser sinensis]